MLHSTSFTYSTKCSYLKVCCMAKVASCDLEVTIESARCVKEIASYIAVFALLVCSTCYRTDFRVASYGVAELSRPEFYFLVRIAAPLAVSCSCFRRCALS